MLSLFFEIMIQNFIVLVQASSPRTTQAAGSNNALIFALIFCLILILLIILTVVAVRRFISNVKETSLEKKSFNTIMFEVRNPKTTEVEVQAADQMFSNLSGISEKLTGLKKMFGATAFISFEIVGLPGSIRFYVVTVKELSSVIEKTINAAYPEAEVLVTNEYNLFADGTKVEFASLKLKEDNYKPIRTYEELNTDTLSSITNSMSKLAPGESMALQIILTSSDNEWRNDGKSYVRRIRDTNSNPEKTKINVDEDVLSSIEKKSELGGFNVDIRMVSTAPTSEAAKINLNALERSFDQFEKKGANSFSKSKKIDKQQFVKDFIYRFPRESFILNTAELASVFHFPNHNIKTPHINWAIAKKAPAPSQVSERGDTWIGLNVFRDQQKQVFFASDDDRRRHMYIIGKTGVGKSSLIQNLALQDIYNGKGLAFLDPHGDPANWLLERIPPHRIEDVIYFNPADTTRPFGFNILEHRNEQEKHLNVNAFLGLMDKMFDPHQQGITGPRFQQAVRNAMLTAMEFPGMTLIEVVKIITDQPFADKLIPKLKDKIVRDYWEKQIAKTADFHKSEILGYVTSKFEMFTTNRLTRNIFGQINSSFDVRKIMDEGKILIVNLSKGEIGNENSQFIGLNLVPKMLSAAMSRADLPEEQRRDFYLYVDEFQNFSTPDFAQILSEARKYRLNLVVANQYIAQMNENIRDAVFGNVGTLVSFKVGPTDAQFVENQFAPTFTAGDLQNIENRNAYVNLIVNGENPGAFSISLDYKNSPKPIPQGNPQVAQLVKNISALRYGRDAKLVEAEIDRRDADDGGPVEPGAPKPPAAPTAGGFGGGGGFTPPLAPGKQG